MKIKKWWTRVGGFCVGASLLSTVLTSCSASKIDEDLIVELDDEGNLIGDNESGIKLDYHEAIRLALTRADSWASFKEALAEEIVCKWFENRAGKDKNQDLQDALDTIEKDINDTYDKNLQSCKDKYGSNYNFYFQNQYLSPNGGTAETYKHALKVQAIKTKFISNVWNSNYFGYCPGWVSQGKKDGVYPRMLEDDATSTINEDTLNNPATWNDLGFFAYAKSGYNPRVKQPASKANLTDEDLNKLAKYALDGDYATIQNFVFEKWFKTEKPFFSAASLFKYSKPTQTKDKSLNEIYNDSLTGVTLPDEPNEAFPFFGGAKSEDKSAGTRAYYRWYHDLVDGVYLKPYEDASGNEHLSNGTTSIDKEGHTDDSQTLLLSYATKMMGSSDGALYVPYATAAAQLYGEALGLVTSTTNEKMNTITQARVEKGFLGGEKEIDFDNENLTPIFKNFFFTEDDGKYVNGVWTPTVEGEIKLESFIDLSKIYDFSKDAAGNFHCHLFVSPIRASDFDFFYGREGSAGTTKAGVKFICNTVRVELTDNIAEEKQPWIFELNESGMHAQTIDGFNVIKTPTTYGQTSKEAAAKNVLKYRLMQKRAQLGDHESISADVFGTSGALAKYFEDNFANIILEMSMLEDDNNVFRPIEQYKKEWGEGYDETQLFFNKIVADNKFDSNINTYLKSTREYDEKKKIVDAIAAANKQVYSYHSEQVKNSKFEPKYKKIYSNGLTAPLAYSYTTHLTEEVDPEWSMHDFSCINPVIYFGWSQTGSVTKPEITQYTSYALGKMLNNTIDGIIHSLFVSKSADDGYNTNEAFSPQIKPAKAVQSNRFWFKSAIADAAVYKSMSSDALVNNIKCNSINQYITKKAITSFEDKIKDDSFAEPITATYYKNKVITGDMTYADVASPDIDFFKGIKDFYDKQTKIQSGFFTDDPTKGGDYSNFNTDWNVFKATLCYLMYDTDGDGVPFDNFYRILNSKISEDEPAFIGYLNKFNVQLDDVSKYKTPTEYIPTSSTNGIRYSWEANVDNIYDQIGYIADVNQYALPDEFNNVRVACDQYWNVINKAFVVPGGGSNVTLIKELAGFTGLQTKTTNVLPTKLQNAVFPSTTDLSAGLAGHTGGSIDLSKSTYAQKTRYAENTGAWFSFTGSKEINGQDIQFEVSWTDGDVTHTINQEQFINDATLGDTSVCRRLAKKMCNYSTLDDLRALAKELGDSHYGTTLYRDIAEGVDPWKHMNINELRYKMVEALPRIVDGDLVNEQFLPCFSRLTNVEVHSTGVDKGGSNISYYFDDDSAGGYNLMLTQISKADITEKTLHPEWSGTEWVDRTEKTTGAKINPITPDEFFFLLCQTACESSTQSLAIAEAVKEIFGNGKLKVMDACLYNAFDSVWIKDWVRKPMGE